MSKEGSKDYDLNSNTNNCICGELDDNRFMIICDLCAIWMHGRCVGIDEVSARDILEYHCPRCELDKGPSKMVDKRKSGRVKEQINYADVNNGVNLSKTIRMKAIDNRTFIDAPFRHLKGHEFTEESIKVYGFGEPVIFDSPEDLDMQMPKSTITVMEIAQIVGDRPIEVMDVSTQESLLDWSLNKWARYFSDPLQRKRILNVISFEISDTPLSQQIIRPKVVRELDWIEKFWPKDSKESPKVQLYCLMSPAECWTDFHIDFGGTSVFYHLLSGRKIFYMIPPTEKNLESFETWCKSPEQAQIFFADLVKTCYKVELLPGNTMMIPAGWIHAVYTQKDAIVIGGNFLHDYSIDIQCRVYELEQRCNVPLMYRFPMYEKLCWYAAMAKAEQLSDSSTLFEIDGLQTLCDFLYKRVFRNDLKKNDKSKDNKKLMLKSIPVELSGKRYREFLVQASIKLTDLQIIQKSPIKRFDQENKSNNSNSVHLDKRQKI